MKSDGINYNITRQNESLSLSINGKSIDLSIFDNLIGKNSQGLNLIFGNYDSDNSNDLSENEVEKLKEDLILFISSHEQKIAGNHALTVKKCRRYCLY